MTLSDVAVSHPLKDNVETMPKRLLRIEICVVYSEPCQISKMQRLINIVAS